MMMQNAELEILAILRRNGANFVEKLLTRAVNLEKNMHKKAANPHADEKPCDEVHELFLKAIDLIHDLEKKKQPTPTPTKAKG